MKTQMKIRYLNGARMQRAITAGANYVISRQDYLNSINVFPVSDSDTGTNVSVTLKAVLRSLDPANNESTNIVLGDAANAALDDARGNSGVIFAQFFQGFYDGSKNLHRIDAEGFVDAYQLGVDYAYQAVADPKQGTILSVLTESANNLRHMVNNGMHDFSHLIDHAVHKAQDTLKKTTSQLKVLKKHNVVDAGAQAFVDFLVGISESIKTGKVTKIDSIEKMEEPIATHHAFDENADHKFQYCTECMVIGDNIDQDKLREQLKILGDSLVVAGSDTRKRVHIHVNDPQTVFRLCEQYGTVSQEKADDMFAQVKIKHSAATQVVIVTDSAADLPAKVIDDLQIQVVPLRLQIGDTSHIDKLTINPTQCYQAQQDGKQKLTTSQPSFNDFANKYRYLASHYQNIISIHIPAEMSATVTTAKNARPDTIKGRFNAIDSNNICVGLGLIVRYAAQLAQKGIGYEEVIRKIEQTIHATSTYAVFADLTYAVRSGRIPEAVKKVTDILHIRPVMTINQKTGGKPKPTGVLWGKKSMAKRFANYLNKQIKPNKQYHLAVSHCMAEQEARLLEKLLKEKNSNILSSYITDCSIALGVHSGPGTLCVGLQAC